jgi:hypothetical protein
MSLETGQLVAHYRIVGKIGEGGPPPLALRTARASYGEVSPKPSMRTPWLAQR